jgi:hypothetical protein
MSKRRKSKAELAHFEKVKAVPQSIKEAVVDKWLHY